MQTILGAGGVIANGLAKILPQYTDKIRLVSRHPRAVNPTDELVSADVTDYDQTEKAVANSEVVYLTVGLPYKLSIWQESWPKIMSNVINACQKHGSKLVFFDNVYLYGKVYGWMTESTPVNPCSKKGEVRAGIAEQLTDEFKKGNLTALIARAADFYGPNTQASFVWGMVFDRLRKSKKAQWLINAEVKHSFSYTPDAGKATALLGNTPEAFNRVWHLPSDKNAWTGKEFIQETAETYNVKPGYTVLRKWMIWTAGLFNSLAKESVEMLYQYETDYLFDSSDFEKRFFKATDYQTGIKESALSGKNG
jgi:nucleoside-diphosphate-sugar epimerase